MLLFALLLIFGLGVGLLSGMLGIGGGVALVPGLILLFGFSQPEAQGTSLAVLIPPIGLFAAIVYYQQGHVRLPVVGWVALGFIIGAYCGARLVPYLPVEALRVGFGLLMLWLGFMFVMSPSNARPATAMPAALATAAAGSAGWLLRRRKRRPADSPNDDIEFHI
jgi:uncharacterized membrane protein YfcA